MQVIVLPFFFANSGWVRQRHTSLGFLLLGFVLLLALIGGALSIVINVRSLLSVCVGVISSRALFDSGAMQGYRGGQLDPYLQTLRIFFIVMLLLPVIPYTAVFVLFALKKTSFFHYRYTRLSPSP
jgi:hypothetical protein